jgi:hypothetical protein
LISTIAIYVFNGLYDALPFLAVDDLIWIIQNVRVVQAPGVQEEHTASILVAFHKLHNVEIEVVNQQIAWYAVLCARSGMMILL